MKRWIEALQQTKLVKSILYFFVGIFSYPGLAIFNKLKITGTENLKELPKKNVLFVSNHQTYFADVITFLHIFSAVKWGKQNHLGIPYYLLNPFTRVYFVAAEETMRSSLISKFFRMAGCITVKRAWAPGSKEVRKGLNPADTRNIAKTLEKIKSSIDIKSNIKSEDKIDLIVESTTEKPINPIKIEEIQIFPLK